MNIIGKNIKKLREERMVTQEQLASKLSVSYQAVSKWETTETVPDTMLLSQIAEFFEVSIDDLFKENLVAYRHRGQRLIALYERNPGREAFAAAEAEMLKIIEMPPYKDAYLQAEDLRSLAVLYMYHMEFFRDRALEYFDKAIEKGMPFREHLYACFENSKISFLCKLNRGRECVEQYDLLIKKEPNNCEHYICGITACYNTEQYDKAKSLADKALSNWQDNVMLYCLAGNVCEKLDEYELALQYWNKSVELDKKRSRETGENGFCDALYSIALYYQKKGDKKRAYQAWKAVIDWLDTCGFVIEKEWPLEMMEKNRTE